MTLYADTPGERLDAFLTRSVPGLSRSAAQRLIEEGQVLRCGKPGKKNDKLNPGDPISYEIPEPKAVDIQPKDIPLDIVYEDEDLLVINKIDLAPYVGASLEVMDRDSKKMRGERPFVFTNIRGDENVDIVVEWIKKNVLLEGM